MANVLGWKDILRPIRDGYRHLFPSPDTGPTPEERERQRLLDSIRGFTYFDNFEQLKSWTEQSTDPIHRANTPLLRRSVIAESSGLGTASIVLCHDYSGNYHTYEGVEQTAVDEERYSCEYLDYVDTFIYFSHKLACVPPPTWTNTLHRNGVQVLGTFLIEPQTQHTKELLHYILTTNSGIGGIHFPLASKLAAIAKHYGFDGWLVNIEKPFDRQDWDVNLLEAFLKQLRNELIPERKLIWYDAITISNKVDYQNALSSQNVLFTQACGNILTNYCWKERDALQSKELANQSGLSSRSISLGIDVWAQNPSSFAHPRVTYPEDKGGGTNTGLAARKLAQIGLSIGIFAPAWTFEHFPGNGRLVERMVWEGRGSLNGINCSCGNANVRHPPNRHHPIARYAQMYAAGGEHFFYTDFSRAFGTHDERASRHLYSGKQLHSQVGSQSVLPPKLRSDAGEDQIESETNVLSHQLVDVSYQTQLEVVVQSKGLDTCSSGSILERWLPLFRFDMPADGTLDIKITYQTSFSRSDAKVSFYLSFDEGIEHLNICKDHTQQFIKARVKLQSHDQCRLKGLGVYLQSPVISDEAEVVRLLSICISLNSTKVSHIQPSIENVHVQTRGLGETKHTRLCWEYRSPGTISEPYSLPYSEITGPCSHFLIKIDGMIVGKAYALEHPLGESILALMADQAVAVSVSGIGFDGEVISEVSDFLPPIPLS
ncbi:glycoside hydrolase family 85 protein [Aaosphaeria arxii CBS 175.79]|uniref:Glycoside hydrolase family 85 protein n=1 Tax=Aaosphaeria arxii CBS 175.79 TaxID=1450172 RepID=A0A6A5XVH1_9PLEO|nr:glycoside hydrolase family 85 protein [Aaosphaeria arxii CBS 175.79]KAF2016630.1 glycoside hydrolase family 85 protein [Aaosphaeria arxii CBS 175.79]